METDVSVALLVLDLYPFYSKLPGAKIDKSIEFTARQHHPPYRSVPLCVRELLVESVAECMKPALCI